MPGPVPRKIVKRDGRVVDFDASRIREAVRKAMHSVGLVDEVRLDRVVDDVLMVLSERFGAEKIPHVEDVQDIVEKALMKLGLDEVAKSYILYRHERTRLREEKKKILEKEYIDEVDKAFSLNALRLMAARYLLKDYDGRLVEGPKQMFQRVAALVVIPDILYDHRLYDPGHSQPVWNADDSEVYSYEGRIGLGPEGDEGFEVLWNRHHLERLAYLYSHLNRIGAMRKPLAEILRLLASKQLNYYRLYRDYYELMVSKKFLPNSPTLFNAGTQLGQLSACFVLDVDDNLESIMETAKEAAVIFKSGGGVGINYSKLRPEGDVVASTQGVASGPISFMRIIDTVTDVIKQGGRRRGANMGVLAANHPDIESFITCKERPGFLENFNISVLIPADFWRYLERGESYPLINPRDGTVWRSIHPEKLLRLAAEMAWKTADPGMLFQDNINRYNPFREVFGDIVCVNPCGEQPLYPYESCNLGSINLYALVREDGGFDWGELARVTKLATRFLDNIIEITKHPSEKIRDRTLRSRRIGLGIMGLADMLYALMIPYNSEEGFRTMRRVMEHIMYYAVEASVELAVERGPFPDFNKSSWARGIIPVEGFHRREYWTLDWSRLAEKIVRHGIRNSHLTTVAPTGSISMLADTSSGLEPQFALAFEKHVTVGRFYYVDLEFERRMKKLGLYTEQLVMKVAENGGSVQGLADIPEEVRRVFLTAYDIPWWDHVRAQYEIQLWVDASVSKTINMPSWATVEDVLNSFLLAYRLGLKGITIYRDSSKTAQVLVTPTQRHGRYSLEIENETLGLALKLGVSPTGQPISVSLRQKPTPAIKDEHTTCPLCGSPRIVFQEGCSRCLDCGWSSCVIA
ncbi:Vitamin B12-dependent ribonucleoside-diphosphate reductase [archaeon HR01]|nr:Vitamin B12-dependent ribonucleoside-diphosphate reductase [archaeon HR01]